MKRVFALFIALGIMTVALASCDGGSGYRSGTVVNTPSAEQPTETEKEPDTKQVYSYMPKFDDFINSITKKIREKQL